MRLATYLGGTAIMVMCSQATAQTQTDLSDNLSKAERMKKIMYENYEASHITTSNNIIDSLMANAANGEHTIKDKQGKIVKQGDFRDGALRDGIFYKYSSTGSLLETHIYKNGKYLTKVMP